MPPQRYTRCRQPCLPLGACADRRRLRVEAVLLLLPRQPGELREERVVRRQERLLAMQDRRVVAAGIVVAAELARPQRQPNAAQQGRMRIALEIGIDQVRDLPRAAMDLDEVRPLDLT